MSADDGDLTAQQDGELVARGSGVFVRWLLANGLVTYPVIVDQGTPRIFPDAGPDTALGLVKLRTTSGGQ